MRFEYKYLINERIYYLLKNDLSLIMDKDPHNKDPNGYNIRSIYFDDFINSDYYKALNGIRIRKKYRLRFYDSNPDFILFEKKKKNLDKTKKQSFIVNLKDYSRLINSNYDFLLNNSSFKKQVHNDLVRRNYKNKILISYDRYAYTLPYNEIRITLDNNLRYSRIVNNMFFKNLALTNVDFDHKRILEVKFNNFLPNHIKNLLSKYGLTRLSISKYVICRQHLRNRN